MSKLSILLDEGYDRQIFLLFLYYDHLEQMALKIQNEWYSVQDKNGIDKQAYETAIVRLKERKDSILYVGKLLGLDIYSLVNDYRSANIPLL